MARPIVSIVISAKNETDRLESCFSSIAEQKTKLPFEVHLVDNNSTDGTYAQAKRLSLRQRRRFFVWKEKKPGAAAARNHGARKARGRILLFTDADCLASPTWVEELARPLLTPSALPLAAVGGFTASAYASRRPKLLERYLDDLFSFWDEDRLEARPAFLPWAPACNLAVRADAFHALGGFDERWRNAAYDVDLCWRLFLCGLVCGYAPRAEVKHLRRGSLRGMFRQMENYAYYNHSLLTTYERELGLSAFSTRKDHLLSRGRRTLAQIKNTTNLAQARFRGLDALVNVAALKGVLESQFTGDEGDAKLAATRRGVTPKALRPLLSTGYAHLHAQGWCYWQAPADVHAEEGDLVLFQPRTYERFRLSAQERRIWEVKSAGGQSEDVARTMGADESDEALLKEIDQLTMDLRYRRLLP